MDIQALPLFGGIDGRLFQANPEEVSNAAKQAADNAAKDQAARDGGGLEGNTPANDKGDEDLEGIKKNRENLRIEKEKLKLEAEKAKAETEALKASLESVGGDEGIKQLKMLQESIEKMTNPDKTEGDEADASDEIKRYTADLRQLHAVEMASLKDKLEKEVQEKAKEAEAAIKLWKNDRIITLLRSVAQEKCSVFPQAAKNVTADLRDRYDLNDKGELVEFVDGVWIGRDEADVEDAINALRQDNPHYWPANVGAGGMSTGIGQGGSYSEEQISRMSMAEFKAKREAGEI